MKGFAVLWLSIELPPVTRQSEHLPAVSPHPGGGHGGQASISLNEVLFEYCSFDTLTTLWGWACLG